MIPTQDILKEYQTDYDNCHILDSWKPIAGKTVKDIYAHRERYKPICDKFKMPVETIGAIHSLESNRNFKTHLHNGDSLEFRTVHVPKGRPVDGQPPFTWEESALDALRLMGTNIHSFDTIPQELFYLEKYNGTGYRNHPGHKSAYLWSGTTISTPGKFVRDGVFDPKAVSDQLGAVAIIKLYRYMLKNDPSFLSGIAPINSA